MAKKDTELVLLGVPELHRALKDFDVSVHKKVIRYAVRQAAKPVLDAARRLVPVRTGALKRSLRIRALRRQRKRTSIGVQVVTGRDFFKGDTYYGGMVEFGTRHMAPRPFLRPARDQAKDQAIAAFRSALLPGLQREIERLEKKARKANGV